MKIKIKDYLKLVVLFLLLIPNNLNADFFEDITSQIVENPKRLSYGVSVTDVNQDGNFDFIVTGFGYLNLALSYENGKLINIVNQKKFSDEFRRTIGVAACDMDKDGYEEIYFLNTDTYSGTKKYSDRLIDLDGGNFIDLFEIKKNQKDLNLTAGRSVACVDRKGDGKYAVDSELFFLVAPFQTQHESSSFTSTCSQNLFTCQYHLKSNSLTSTKHLPLFICFIQSRHSPIIPKLPI